MIRVEQLYIEDLAKIFIKRADLEALIRKLINDPNLNLITIDMLIDIFRKMKKSDLLDLIYLINPELLNGIYSAKQLELLKLISECVGLLHSVNIGNKQGEVLAEDREKFAAAILKSRGGLAPKLTDDKVQEFIDDLLKAKKEFLDAIIPLVDPSNFSDLQKQLWELIKNCKRLADNTPIGITPGSVFKIDKDIFEIAIIEAYKGLNIKYKDDEPALNRFISDLTAAREIFLNKIITENGFVDTENNKYYGESNEFNPDPNKYEWIPMNIFLNKYWVSFADIPAKVLDMAPHLIHIYGMYIKTNEYIYTFFDLPEDLKTFINNKTKSLTFYENRYYCKEDIAGEVNTFWGKNYSRINCELVWKNANLQSNIRVSGYYVKCTVDDTDYLPTSRRILEKRFNAKGIFAYE